VLRSTQNDTVFSFAKPYERQSRIPFPRQKIERKTLRNQESIQQQGILTATIIPKRQNLNAII
jgi:hypothetical protein